MKLFIQVGVFTFLGLALIVGCENGVRHKVWVYDGVSFMLDEGGTVRWIEFSEKPFSDRVRIKIDGDEKFRTISEMTPETFANTQYWRKLEFDGRLMYTDLSLESHFEFQDGRCVSAQIGPDKTTLVAFGDADSGTPHFSISKSQVEKALGRPRKVTSRVVPVGPQ